MLDGKSQQGMAAFEFQFRADVGSVMLDRADANEQLGGNLFADFVSGNQFENVPLSGSENIQARFLRRGLGGAISATTLNEVSRERWTDVVLTGGNGFDRISDFEQRAVFEHIE